MLKVGDLIRHSELGTHGIIVSIYAGWDNKYCNVMWIETGYVSQAILTADCQKVS